MRTRLPQFSSTSRTCVLCRSMLANWTTGGFCTILDPGSGHPLQLIMHILHSDLFKNVCMVKMPMMSLHENSFTYCWRFIDPGLFYHLRWQKFRMCALGTIRSIIFQYLKPVWFCTSVTHSRQLKQEMWCLRRVLSSSGAGRTRTGPKRTSFRAGQAFQEAQPSRG